MLLFRSEEHVDAWRDARGIEPGGTMTVEQQWELAKRWYSNRMDESWYRRSLEEAQQVLADCGLTDPFWSLA